MPLPTQLALWFPLPVREALKLVSEPSLAPFFLFFALLLRKSQWNLTVDRLLCRRHAAASPEQPKRSAAGATMQTVFPPESDAGSIGQNRYGSYRIPALLQVPGGALLAFAEGRGPSKKDWGAIDTVLRRSLDGGQTWSPLAVVASGDDVCLPGATVGNPCPVWDQQNERVVLLLTATEAGAAEPAVWCGTASPRRVFVTMSSDAGSTWSKPREISTAVRQPGWTWYATGPGRGIQLQGGSGKSFAQRLVVPCDHVVTSRQRKWWLLGYKLTHFDLRSHVLLSDDGGQTWRLGGDGPAATNECQVAELQDGSILLNMRDFSGRGLRRQALSRDGGESFSDLGHHGALLEPHPAGCQASILSVPAPSQQLRHKQQEEKVAVGRSDVEKTLLFSGPSDIAGARRDLRIRWSSDSGCTWPGQFSLYPGPSAYSCLELCSSSPGSATETSPFIGNLFEAGVEGKDPYGSIQFWRSPALQDFFAS